jgi:hypothetical protein
MSSDHSKEKNPAVMNAHYTAGILTGYFLASLCAMVTFLIVPVNALFQGS